MLKETLRALFERDLQKLRTEIDLYIDEDQLWILKAGISNSAGNLCLHLVGNLNHFIGATLGNTGYVRHREEEFSSKNIPRKGLLNSIDNCIQTVDQTLTKLLESDLEKEYPLEKHGKRVSTMHMLLHLYGHLSYHLGQINYHRRMIHAK